MRKWQVSSIKLAYDTYLGKLEAKIVSTENGDYVIRDKNYFPSAGREVANLTTKDILNWRVINLSSRKLWAPQNPDEEPYIIKHYYENDNSFNMSVRRFYRESICETCRLYTRYHSDGHLLSHAVNKLHPPKSIIVTEIIFPKQWSPLPNLQRVWNKKLDEMNKWINW